MTAQPTQPVVLVRKYTDSYGKLVTYPQCKIFKLDNFVAFRDIWQNKSRLFRDDAWNIDHIILDWLKEFNVEDIYYYERKTKILYHITLRRIHNALKMGFAYKEKLNNHTQYFIPKTLWTTNPKEKFEVLKKSNKWIKTEVDCSWKEDTFNKLEDKAPEYSSYVDTWTKLKELYEARIVRQAVV